MSSEIVIPTSRKRIDRQAEDYLFAHQLEEIQKKMKLPDGRIFKIGARGWAYQLEDMRLINKDEFDKIQDVINNLRKKGILPIDFTSNDEKRLFSGVEFPNDDTPIQHMRSYLVAAQECEKWYTPDWWREEDYYIQVLVEKEDLVTLFKSTCNKYHIPIGNSRGWSSMNQRATYANRFKEAEDAGLECVLLYLGDFDPDGLRISEFLRKNLEDLKEIRWSYGGRGYDPKDLIIDRFGLNYDFITKHNLTWIDNLITGSGKDLASPSHPNYNHPYVQDYLKKYGARKCEANALIVRTTQAIELLTTAIEKYLGADALHRFKERRQEIVDEVTEFRDRTGLSGAIDNAIEIIDDESEEGVEI